jgi:signal transduction histidine kinase
MSGIDSTLSRRWVEISWGVFAAANVAFIFFLGRWETIPFHFVWVSFSLVYGVRLWSLRATVITLSLVSLITGWALLRAATQLSGPGLDEMAEVPLMAAMFVAMVWHARRGQAALAEVNDVAESRHRLLERERDFARDASHELRTPITVARGHAELIREAHRGTQTAEDAGVILDELATLAKISDRLLLLAAAERPDFLQRSPVELEPLIIDTVNRWSPVASRNWRVNAIPEGTLDADQERLRIALDALIENALKYTTEGDMISLSARANDGSVVIEVADTGYGIPGDETLRIFERFTRADQSRARQGGGNGLGLAIVKAIVVAHGGSVNCASERGQGATFNIRLPGFSPVEAPAMLLGAGSPLQEPERANPLT